MRLIKTNARSIRLFMLLFFGVLFLFPMFYTVYYSMLPLADYGRLAPLSHITFENYNLLLSKYNVAGWTVNTVIITLAGVCGSLLVNLPAGYALGSMNFPGRTIVFYCVLGSMMVPFQCIITPIYIQVSSLGWADQLVSCVVPFLMNCLYIFIARQYFCTFPRVLHEAAFLDGLGELGVFFRIVLPNSIPIVITLTILCFTGMWNSYLIPSTFLTTSDKFPLAVGIKTVKDYMFEQKNMTLAGVVILSLPILVCFFALQRYFVKGVVTAGIK